MIKKVFLITEFGSPFSWTDKYIQNAGELGKYGWYWKIFTPNKYSNLPDNVEIVDMTAEQYAELVERKLSIKTNMFTTKNGVPSVHITDFYIFSGLVFKDYIKDFDFWGITNMDVVYGRLDHFVPDSILEECDVWTDDIGVINGVFCLWRNSEEVNNLCKKLPGWEQVIAQPPCQKCITGLGGHSLFGSDEYGMTEVMKTVNVRYKYPKYYPIHSYDRLETQVPNTKLSIKDDGTLWELCEDTAPPNWIHAHKYFGREVGYYHFGKTKKWPNIA